MEKFMPFIMMIVEKFKQGSTWAALLAAVGIGLSGAELEAIVGLGVAIMVALGVFLDDSTGSSDDPSAEE